MEKVAGASVVGEERSRTRYHFWLLKLHFFSQMKSPGVPHCAVVCAQEILAKWAWFSQPVELARSSQRLALHLSFFLFSLDFPQLAGLFFDSQLWDPGLLAVPEVPFLVVSCWEAAVPSCGRMW